MNLTTVLIWLLHGPEEMIVISIRKAELEVLRIKKRQKSNSEIGLRTGY